MQIEDKLPDSFKLRAFHPSAFFYAWKKTHLEKLFEEFLKSNIAVKSVEAILVADRILRTIPLQNGQIKLFEWSHSVNTPRDEEWFDFVERGNKEVLDTINGWDLEKQSRPDLRNRIWYHFELGEE